MSCKTKCAANMRSAIRRPILRKTGPSARSRSRPAIRTGRSRPAKATTQLRVTTDRVPPGFLIRKGAASDAGTVVAHRRATFREMGYRDEQALDRMCVAFGPWLVGRMQTGEYLAWFAVGVDGAIAAGLGLWLMDWPPHLIGPGARVVPG